MQTPIKERVEEGAAGNSRHKCRESTYARRNSRDSRSTLMEMIPLTPAGPEASISIQPETSFPEGPSSEDNVRLRREAIIKQLQNPQSNTIISTPDAALYFGVKPRTIYRWKAKGKLKSGTRRGSITIESVLRLINKRSKRLPNS